jgi:hypothetical protein
LETVKIASPNRGFQGETRVTLQNGQTLKLPFTSQWKSATFDLHTGKNWFALDTVLLFPLDNILETYIESFPTETRDAHYIEVDNVGYASIGYIDLIVQLGEQYTRFSYVAVTSHMSKLFASSPSVQLQFLKLLQRADGIVGFLNLESYEFPMLGNISKKIKIDNENGEYDSGDPDKLMQVILPLLPH